MSETLVWVIGSGGLLGSHTCRALNQHLPNARFWEAAPPRLSWADPIRLSEELSEAVPLFVATALRQHSAWVLVWCAGVGVMSSAAAAFEPEWSAWTQLLDLLGRHLSGPGGDVPGSVFLASSAGGIYGGSPDEILTERSPACPSSDYGAHKLRMEESLQSWIGGFPAVSSLIGRISSLYGPGQNLRKAQGIIAHLSRCLIYRRPVNIYVPLDSRRDYLFAEDCAHQIAASLRRLMVERPGPMIKIFACEQLTCLSRIVGIFLRIAKFRPLMVSRQPRGTQPTSLQLRSDVWRDLKGLRRTDLAVGIHLVHQHQLALFRQGQLPPPS